MIRSRMSLNYSGVWEIELLFEKLQEIITDHPDEFSARIPEYD